MIVGHRLVQWLCACCCYHWGCCQCCCHCCCCCCCCCCWCCCWCVAVCGGVWWCVVVCGGVCVCQCSLLTDSVCGVTFIASRPASHSLMNSAVQARFNGIGMALLIGHGNAGTVRKECDGPRNSDRAWR